jgi:hypothetical protein
LDIDTNLLIDMIGINHYSPADRNPARHDPGESVAEGYGREKKERVMTR